MSFVIRPARAEDVPLIAEWTRDTFSWGDYVAEALPDWFAEPDTHVMVCVYDDNLPVAVCRVQMLSPTEAWLSGARVHPEHRRSGLGSEMNHRAVAWARERGARVVRLAAEEDNEPARSQVLKLGYRVTSHWVHAVVSRSRGRRLSPSDRLRPGATVDADAAWTFWSQSDLAGAGRELIALGWRWRKATKEDLDRAVEARSFYQSRAGWVIAVADSDDLFVNWMATARSDAPLLIQGLRDLLREESRDTIEAMVPVTAWTVEALQREGFETHPIQIFAKGL